MKKLTTLLALTAGIALMSGADASAQDYYYDDQPAYGYSYDQSEMYGSAYDDGVSLDQYLLAPLTIVQPVRETAADTANLYMEVHPGYRFADSMGLLDRGFVTGLLRGH